MYELMLQFVQRAGPHRAQSIEGNLKKLIEIIHDLCSYRFFASSLLKAFEGDVDPEEDGELRLKLIDFSHIYFSGFKSQEEHLCAELWPGPGNAQGTLTICWRRFLKTTEMY